LLSQFKRGIKIEGRTHDVVQNLLLKLRNADGLKSFTILFQILFEISKSKDYSCLASTRYSNTYDENDIKRINDVYKYVMENFTEVISLDSVSSIAYMTPSAFCKYFKNKTNKTFTHFVNEIRINYACELLMNKNLDISQISIQCGFNNFTSFNKNFKYFTKTTPSTYRTKFAVLN
jgi:AraC-like DNA-binding protein